MTLNLEQQSRTVRRYPDNWDDVDTQAIDTARVLAADAVQNCGSGHPGTAMSLAPLAYTLYQRVMNHNPNNTLWAGRDRFVLSCGHSSLTQYIQLYLGGFGLELDDLKALRTWGSLTPGHPEYGHTDGVEITTGPLGQGLATAVGMAMASRRERGLFDPEAAPGTSPFDHYIYVIASDGDLQEGVTAEASSLAGTQKLGNLIVFWDDNEISIEDDTNIAFTEDVVKRYDAYGWHTQTVDSAEDIVALEQAIQNAQAEVGRPSFIRVRSIIGHPAPTLQNTGAAHGAALGDAEVAAVKEILGFNAQESFAVDPAVIAHTRKLQDRGAEKEAAWQEKFDQWASANPDNAALFARLEKGELPDGWDVDLPEWNAGDKVATRKASHATLQALGATLPELWGGSADLAGSNNTTIEGADSFGPESISTDTWTAQPYGRNLHFGIREHAMAAIINGMALHGGTRPYAGTFLIFSEYMRPALRLGALMEVNTYHVWTHDSIGLGEDGPTHQPVEQLASLRAMPGVAVLRPADANETAAAWRAALLNEQGGPKGLALSRQDLTVLEGTKEKARAGVERGAYVLVEASSGTPDVIVMASGSEVELAVEAAIRLEADGIATRVVSVPCLDWFEQQDQAYIDQILPPEVTARVSVEAGIAMPWYRWIGSAGKAVSLEHFGASADYKTLYQKFGITADAVYEAARGVVK